MDFEPLMECALELAGEASRCGEVPVGCVVTDENGAVIGVGRNRREEKSDATAHAEIEAIRAACAARGSWNLSGCALIVTLEPCPMCAGAIINARISTVVYGAKEEHTGSCGSVINLFEERYPQKPAVYGGVLRERCKALLTEFFRTLR